jgi:hypothetical protein
LTLLDPNCHSYTVHGSTDITSTRDHDKNSVVKLDKAIYSVSLTENKNLLLYSSADQMPVYKINNCFDINALIEPLSYPIISNSEAFFGSYKWRPLGSGHKHRCITDDSGTKCCVSSVTFVSAQFMRNNTDLAQVLQLAFVKCTLKKARKYSEMKCLLIKGSVSSDDCTEIDLEKPFPSLEHEVVGILDGIDLHKETSIGQVVAITKKRHRIAIATWDRVLLYSINPSAFLKADVGSLAKDEVVKVKRSRRQSLQFSNKSREFADEEDATYSKHTGQGYYRDYEKFYKKRIVRLTPIELPSRGVVHKLHFVGKNSLWAWTDRGLVKWDWSPKTALQEGVVGQRPLQAAQRGLRDERQLTSVPVQFHVPLFRGKEVKPKSWIETVIEDMEWQQDVSQ